MTNQNIISADSHFVEPPEMWRERIDAAFKDRAPHIVPEPDRPKSQVLVCEDLTPSNGGGFLAAGVDPEDVPRVLALGYEVAPAHMRDPAARIAAQQQDGVSAEVMYASYGMSLYHVEDGALRSACFRAFNDWAAEYCSYDPKRLHGIGLVALEDVDAAVVELERTAAKGLKGAMIWAEPPEDRPYSHEDYDPFWSAAQDLDMKLALHSLTSRRKNFNTDPVDVIYRSVVLYQEVARTMSDLILHGVLERFPRLRFVSAENEVGWLPFHLWRMDQLHEKLHAMSTVKLSMKPSDYFYRQFYATFIEDPLFPATLPYIGSGNIMWSSDFPHLASTWPHSQEFITKNLSGLPEKDCRNIVHDNAAKLYGIAER
ncbi:MAG TPA: amidohydrolase family protein [Acidimicrobiales bacterium]|nr:amidohydrolase family protein [Acidimicrobiales bacterium]